MTKSSSVGFFELFFNIFNPWLAESTHIEGQLWSLFLNLGRDLSPQTTNSADLWWLYLYYTFVFYFTLTCALSPIVLLYLYLFYSFFEINLLLIFWLLKVKLRLSSVQFSRSVVSDSLQPHESQHTRPPCPSPTPEFTQTHVHWVSDAIQPSHPLLSPSPPAPNPSQHQSLFQWINSSHEVAKVLDFSFSIIPSKEIPGLISLRMDWLDLLAVQGTLRSLFQHHSSKASILWHSAFFISRPYMTTGKSIALTSGPLLAK